MNRDKVEFDIFIFEKKATEELYGSTERVPCRRSRPVIYYLEGRI